ncbi:MAG: hypothetical protein O0X93_09090 [Methanocorpusculum sp.]|nr:hypothetical protein [Methanocorpusculum sp.]MDE2524683.1 hypothetical protein [Methanocorpusculum sp.]
MALGTVVPIAILGYFKYTDFGIASLNGLLASAGITVSLPLMEVILPIGISFFTFQALSYIFDIYLEKLEPEKELHKYALFIAFFPALVAGPIIRASEFLPQLKSKIEITGENIQAGVTLILWGLFKKMVIADNVGIYVDRVFAYPPNYPSVWIILATILFGIQIYCDFSGYAHIAIGSGRILGFKIPDNFDLPYLAKNIQIFWRKWHMTLSRFIRDYVYIPLGGNRKGHGRTYANLFASMVICGLWHGAAWTFVIWGAYHGGLLLLHRYFIGERKWGASSRFLESNPGLWTKILITQILVFFGWLIFRANTFEDLLYCIEKIIFFDFITDSTYGKFGIFAVSGFLIVTFLLMCNRKTANFFKRMLTYNYLTFFSKTRPSYWLVYIVLLGSAIILFAAPVSPEFIYFAF